MGKPEAIPTPTVRRLSLYLRQLEAFRESNLKTISSKQLGQALHITDAQVRKDLAHFGTFGQPGIGYDIEELIAKLRRILGTDRTWNVLLVGAGNLGRALLAYRGFTKKGFRVVAVFDEDATKHGQAVGPDNGLRIQPMAELADEARRQNIRLAMLAVPANIAQQVTDGLIDAGIQGVLNFAPTSLHVPAGVTVAHVDMAVHLEQLSFNIRAGDTQDD